MPNQDAPLFTVIICTYNRAPILAEAIAAVLRQTMGDFELLVVDDGSEDQTKSVCAAIEDPRLRYYRRSNGGLSAARNTGLEHSLGQYVIFIDDDDRASRSWLAELRHGIVDSRHPESVGVVSCGARFVDPRGDLIQTRLPKPKPRAFSAKPTPVLMLAGCFAVRRDIHDAIGGYEESILTTHQTELALRLLPYCDRHRLEVVSIAKALIDIEERAIADRPLNQPEELLDSVEFVLDAHDERMKRCRPTHARYRSVAGVSAAQIGEMSRARRHLLRAVLALPSPRHVTRLAMAVIPGGARRWRRHWA